jgi:hypothetical protein
VVLIAGFILVGNVIAAVSETFEEPNTDPRHLQWDRYDVIIEDIDTAANSFQVSEQYALYVQTGPFRYGFAEIPKGRLESIGNVAVFEEGTPLPATCAGTPGTSCVHDGGDVYSIEYNFTRPIQSGESRAITIRYTVYGALRSYSGGDQLYWVAVPADRAFPVMASQVTVTMPEDRPPLLTASYPGTWTESIAGNVITWESPGRMDEGDSVEVRVQYEHDPRMEKPGWQPAYDREQTYLDNWQPIVSLLLAASALLLTVGGVLFVVLRYLKHGRDPQALVVPEYLTEPPSDERPGVVGLLLDEKADMQDVMATLLDLARRGLVVIEQTEKSAVGGLLSSAEFAFHRTEAGASDLRPYEAALLKGLFPQGRETTTLSQLRTKFYTHIPNIKRELYADLLKQGYFPRSPETTRQLWMWGGIALMVIASVAFWLLRGATLISPLIILPPIGMGIVGLAAALASEYMPAKTARGAQEAARWNAFKRYLKNIESHGDLAGAAAKFEAFLAYAIAFGIEKDLVRQMVPAMTAMPGWYVPTYLGGPWHGGYRREQSGQPVSTGGPGSFGGFSVSGPGGLNEMSHSLTEGLNAMNSGLTRMLNDASSAMTSRPKSSGGGGFSGGGRRGGGGSGGGRRGFG